jgi:hypothetical protein
MTDIQDRLRTAMHAAVDHEQALSGELINMVIQRHRRHTVRLACIAVLAALAVAVPAAITWHDRLGARGLEPPAHRPSKSLPTKMSGLPMPAGTNVQLLVSAGNGAAWYSTAPRQAKPVTALPASNAGYQFNPVYGGWIAWSNDTASSSCPLHGVDACAGRPNQFFYIADGSLTATRVGAGFWADGVVASSRPGAVWLATYPRVTAKLTGSGRAQLVSTTGRPLGPRYRLPPDYLLGTGVGSYLLLVNNLQQNLFILWDPRTGRILRHIDHLLATGPEQIAWSPNCQGCRVQILNVSTGTTVTPPIPGRNPAALAATFSDDGRLLAVQPPGRDIEVFDTASRTLTAIPGTALSSADWQNFGWQADSHRLVISAGPNNQPGPAQLAYWQPGDTHLRIATIHNLGEITNLQTGNIG